MSDFLIIKSKTNESIDRPKRISEFEHLFINSGYCSALSKFTKFYNDCYFSAEDENIHLSFAGVVLNSKNYLNMKRNMILGKEIIYQYSINNYSFYKNLFGSFFGAIYQKEMQKLLIFTDLLSNYPLYYYDDDNLLIASNSITLIADTLKENNIPFNIEQDAVYSIASYGYLLGDSTIVKEIRRVPPGGYIQYINGKTTVISESAWENNPFNGTDEEAIDKIDELFLEGIKLQALKNEEYGYPNLTALSGGLDSRMCVFALKRLKVKDVTCFTYSQTGQIDQLIPQKITHDLGYRWLFKSLDSGEDLINIDEAIRLSDTRCYYLWASQLNNFLKHISTDSMGLVHTGVIGDVVIGTFCHDYYQLNKKYDLGDGAFSTYLISKISDDYINKFEKVNYEDGMLFNRAYNGACLGYSTVFQNYTEALSPFMYPPLFDFCRSIPPIKRYQHNLYFKWIKKYYPEAIGYEWNGMKIPESKYYITMNKKKIYLDTIPSRIKQLITSKLDKSFGMNPIDTWLEESASLKIELDHYFYENFNLLDDFGKLKNDIEQLYKTNSAMNKVLAISALGFLKTLLE